MTRKDTTKRSLLKAISWRFIGALDTALISWFLTGNPVSGLNMGIADVLGKILFFYLHERFWEKLYQSRPRWLLNPKKSEEQNIKRIHFFKSLTWRLFSSTLTVLFAWLILNDIWVGLQIGFIEVVTKIGLYYFHERLWHRSSYGVSKNE